MQDDMHLTLTLSFKTSLLVCPKKSKMNKNVSKILFFIFWTIVFRLKSYFFTKTRGSKLQYKTDKKTSWEHKNKHKIIFRTKHLS